MGKEKRKSLFGTVVRVNDDGTHSRTVYLPQNGHLRCQS